MGCGGGGGCCAGVPATVATIRASLPNTNLVTVLRKGSAIAINLSEAVGIS